MAYDKVVDSTVLDGYFSDIADAIRDQGGTSATLTPAQMPQAIEDIPTMDSSFAALLSGDASGVVTVRGIEDLSCTQIVLRNATELHMPDLVYFTTEGSNRGGLMDLGSASKLEVLDMPKCERLYMNNFNRNTSEPTFRHLRALNTPKLKRLQGYLRGVLLTELNLPELEVLGKMMYSTALTHVVLPKYNSAIESNAFINDSALTTVELGNSELAGNSVSLPSGSFRNTGLTSLVLRYSSAVTLSSRDAFLSSPIASGTGYIYVPRDLVATYQAATNWATYSAQFRALEDYTVDGSIDGDLDPTKI